MVSLETALLLGLTATLVGAVQLGTTVAGMASGHLLSVIAALRLFFCGSLLVVAPWSWSLFGATTSSDTSSTPGRLAPGLPAGSVTA